MRLRPHRPGLRARITLAFGLGALLLSTVLAGTTWTLTRSQLLDQRERTSLRQAYLNARLVRDGLSSAEDASDFTALDLLGSLQTPVGAQPMLVFQGEFYSQSPVEFGEGSLPEPIRGAVVDGDAATMRYVHRGEPVLAIGIPIPAAGAEYFEVVSLEELDDTLRSLAIVLMGAAFLTTLAGAALGWAVAGRALRPLTEVGQAAQAIAGGRLDTRLGAIEDPDLGVLVSSFNHMAQVLEERIEQDNRFASDVSHELRSPLMTLSASIEVLSSRREEMPDASAQAAVDLMVADVARFKQLVEDLLEISRFDAGAARLELSELRPGELVTQAVAWSETPDVPIELDSDLAGVLIRADKRRLVRVLANLLDNARKYGAEPFAVATRHERGEIVIDVMDSGPGIPEAELERLKRPFTRLENARTDATGTGLGLAIVDRIARLHGGRFELINRPGSGLIGRLRLPVRQ